MQDRQTISDALSVVAAMPDLSPPALVLALTAAGAAAPLIELGPEVAEKVVGEAIGQAVGEIAGAIPVVGFFVSIATSIIKLVGSSAEQRAAQHRAACQATFQRRRVLPSGSKLGGCEQCPCDLFRVVDYGTGAERSLLGQALVAITEGGEMGPVNPFPTPTFGRWWRERYAMVGHSAGTALADEDRLQYRKLRIAMERAYVEPGSDAFSDGGVAFWPAYLDKLLRDVDRGRITSKYVDLCLGARFLPKVKGRHVVTTDPRVAQVGGLRFSPGAVLGARGALVVDTDEWRCYVPALRDAVFSLVSGWRDSVRPRYDEGKRALAEVEAVARQLRNVQGGLLGDLSPRPSRLRAVAGLALAGGAAFAVAKPALVATAGGRALSVAGRTLNRLWR